VNTSHKPVSGPARSARGDFFTRRAIPGLLLLSLAAPLAACVPDAYPATEPLWTVTTAPVLDESDPVEVDAGRLRDGTYWADVSALSGTDAVVFHVARVRFGEACERWATEMLRENGCLNDYGVEEYPSAHVALDPRADVSLADPSGPGRNLTIDAAVLTDLVHGDPLPTPAGYTWVPFPFVLAVRGGVVVAAHQLWVP